MPMIMITHHHHHEGDCEQREQHAAYHAVIHKMLEIIMAQLEDLQATSKTIKEDLDKIRDHLASQAEKIAALTDQLTQLSQSVPPQVDLSSVVAAANDIRSEADAIVASFTPTPAEPPAEPAPPADDGSGSADVTA
jgi:uncharacterized coiled-coil DUF342 family protein